jgi:Tol biopolymer transport system component
MRILLLPVLLTACGNVESSPDAASRPDAPVQAPDASAARCNSTADFGVPAKLDALATSTDEFEARLSRDERTIFFSRTNAHEDIMVATRATASDPFGAPQPLAAVNGDSDGFGPTLTGDGLTLYFSSNRAPSQALDLWAATRTSTAAAFGAPMQVAGLASQFDDYDPFISEDGNTLYWWVLDLNTGWDIWRATRGANGFGTPTRVDELSSDGNDGHVALSADGLTIYFGSSRTGTSGADDIYVATRTSAGDRFGTPVRVAGVNSTAMDEPSWVSDDGCLLYLFSNRGGNYDLYVASRPPP